MSGEGELAGRGGVGGGVRRRQWTRGAHKTAVTKLDFSASRDY